MNWRKSSYSTHNGNCVEVGRGDAVIGVRDSKDCGNGPVLTFSSDEWERWIGRIKADS